VATCCYVEAMRPFDLRRTGLRTWRRANLAGHRAIVVVGRPVAAARGVWDDFVDWVNALGLSENTILIGFAVVVGVGGALGVVAFYKLIDAAYGLFYRAPETFLSRSDFLAWRPLVTATGLAAAWACYRRFGKGLAGLNVPDVQLRVARHGGRIPGRPALARTAASALTIGYTLTREVVLFYPLLGAVTGLMSALFIWCFFHAEEWAARLPLPRAALPWIGGALVGALVYLSRASWWDTGTWRSISRCSGRSRGTCCCCSPWARSWRPRSR
jgi:H+/Cl- antiporter ClcA